MLTKEIVRTIGIDVHSETYSISTYNPHSESFIGECTIEAEAKNVIKYVARLRKETAVPVSIEVGYEAGPTGFGLKRELEKAGIRCHVMAPTSIYRPAAGVRVKTDARDARSLARAVYWGSYSEVMPLSEEDEAYRDYIRMRDDRHEELKRAKQHLLSFILRRGKQYQGKNYWTRMHMGWLKKIEFRNPVDQLTFKEYLNEVTRLMDAIELLDAKIEEFSKNERYAENVSKLRYAENVSKLRCFAGIDTHSAMVMVTEIGDYSRFPSAETFASYLGLTPGEHSSGKSAIKTGITKAGNAHCRRILCESANSLAKSNPYKKSKRLLSRQKGMDPDVIAYADRGTARMKRKFFYLKENGKNTNVAKAACARELACFIWGMITGHYDSESAAS